MKEASPRRSGRKRKPRVLDIDGYQVLRLNRYTLEAGEPSVFDSELGKKVEAQPSVRQAKKPCPAKLKPQRKAHPPTARQLLNTEIEKDLASTKACRTLFMANILPILRPFLTEKVAERLHSDSLHLRSAGHKLPRLQEITEHPTFISNGILRDYQLKGLEYLVSTFDRGISAILADEMGLGKTLQTISFLAYLKFSRNISGPHLIVCPLSVLSSWMSELARWCPQLKALRIHSSDRPQQEILKKELLPGVSTFDVIVTTYEMLQSGGMKGLFHGTIFWRYLVLDEGHRIKNEETAISAAVKSVRRQATLLLTGTPLQNNLHEFWALLSALYPDIFTSSQAFDDAFNLHFKQHFVDKDMLEKAHLLLKSLSLRRLKTEVEKLLPPKTETKIFCPLSKMQHFWYKRLLLKNSQLLARLEAEAVGDNVEFQKDKEDWRKLFSLLAQLRKVSNHPFMMPGAELDPDMATAEDLVVASGKMQLLDRLLVKLQAAGHRVALFSQFTQTLDVIDDYCNMRGFQFCRLDGSTNRVQRMIDMKMFNKPSSPYFMYLLSTRAGGLGINIQTADTVILFDSDWNPQVDLQAMARVHRIGQTKPVHIYRLVTAGTVEERIQCRAEKKLYLDMMVNRGNMSSLDSEASADAGELLKTIKFGAQAMLKMENVSELTDADVDLIIDRTRTGAPEVGKKECSKLQGCEQTAATFQTEQMPMATHLFEGVDYGSHANDSLKDIGAAWAKLNSKNRKRTKTTVEIDGFMVLRRNCYTLEDGEPSIFQRELLNNDGPQRKKQQKAGTDYDNDDTCLYCWDGGDLVLCDSCPASYHPDCVEITKKELNNSTKWQCPQHACWDCGKKAQAAGGLLFRCEMCPKALCEDHLPEEVEVSGMSQRFARLGYEKPTTACYILCSLDCANWAASQEADVKAEPSKPCETPWRSKGVVQPTPGLGTHLKHEMPANVKLEKMKEEYVLPKLEEKEDVKLGRMLKPKVEPLMEVAKVGNVQ